MNLVDHGQWVGLVKHGNGVQTLEVLNIEKRNPALAQISSVWLSDIEVRGFTVGAMQITDDGKVVIERPDVSIFDPQKQDLVSFEEFLKQRNDHGPIPTRAIYTMRSTGRVLEGTFETDIGGTAAFELTKTSADDPIKADQTLTWKEFKSFITDQFMGNDGLVFRGQADSRYKLRTLFHRCNRNNLLYYLQNDVPKLRHAVNALSNFYYREKDAEHLGALLSVAQHHGYPTPLLDWTASPYIAAFFAFTQPTAQRPQRSSARIFAMDIAKWTQGPRSLRDPLPGIHFLMPPAHNNPRFTPQQSFASFSNIDDMEMFIRNSEISTHQKCLTVIDIPLSERSGAINDLTLMGITPGSLFPGLDGTCRALKERYFEA
jgi:hypothetical protein